MFKLSDLLQYNNILIQCHDNPDPDTISSAFGIYTYLSKHGKKSKIIYSGIEKIKKKNIQFMLEWLNIPIEHIKNTKDFQKPDLLICVDCQCGEGNVTRIEAVKVAVIDHHLQVAEKYDIGIIQPQLGSCATLVWNMLKSEGFDFSTDKNVSTALYYGLFTDTNDFSEINHPLDKDMRDILSEYCDKGIIKKLSMCNLSIDELEIAGVALLRNYVDAKNRYAIFKSEFCDPNILGIISDFTLKVDTVDICMVYSQREDGAKISVRSCAKEVMASELACFITNGVGSGGGHRDKAGGWIKKTEIAELGISIDEYIKRKTVEYFDNYDILNASDHQLDISNMNCYCKKPIPRGFVVSTDVFEANTPLMIRMIEGDSYIQASSDIYLMIGILGEVYPIKSEKFHANYKICNQTVNLNDDIYTPKVTNKLTGEIKELLPLMKSCMPLGNSKIYAKTLIHNTKVFTNWNPDGYMYGSTGDYLAINYDDINDVYIIRKDVFEKSYEKVL